MGARDSVGPREPVHDRAERSAADCAARSEAAGPTADAVAPCWAVPLGVRTAGSLQASRAALGLRSLYVKARQ